MFINGRKSSYWWSLCWKLFDSLLLLLAKTEASGTTAAVSGTPTLANLQCLTFNPFSREALECSVYLPAIFSAMLFLRFCKKTSELRLPQEVDATGRGFRQGSALSLWAGTAWWNCWTAALQSRCPPDGSMPRPLFGTKHPDKQLDIAANPSSMPGALSLVPDPSTQLATEPLRLFSGSAPLSPHGGLLCSGNRVCAPAGCPAWALNYGICLE